ncbi:hypothetical protein VTO73DRAFT_2227 [Trametes versicolor]
MRFNSSSPYSCRVDIYAVQPARSKIVRASIMRGFVDISDGARVVLRAAPRCDAQLDVGAPLMNNRDPRTHVRAASATTVRDSAMSCI